MAPPDNICVIMKPENTSAMPVSVLLPSLNTHQVSINLAEACVSITSMFGQAMPSRVGTMAPCSSLFVR